MTSETTNKSAAQKQKQFERLFAARHDFDQARFCAHFLLKKKWHANPWERRGTIYQQQTAFVTNLIVAYSRPFTASKGWPSFPMKLVRFSDEQIKIHHKIIELRHQVFAHSDSQHFKFQPWHVDGFRTTIENVPFAVISSSDAKNIEGMATDLINAVSERLEQLHLELV